MYEQTLRNAFTFMFRNQVATTTTLKQLSAHYARIVTTTIRMNEFR
jgi:hypothetical protein